MSVVFGQEVGGSLSVLMGIQYLVAVTIRAKRRQNKMVDTIQITRTDVIVVDTIGSDSYGNLNFTDKAGKEYKVGVKRLKYFENIIKPEMAVQLSYAMSTFGKEYIYKAELVSGKLPTPTSEAPQSQTSPVKKEMPQEVSKTAIAPQEKGMFIKELGEMIRSNTFKRETEIGKVGRAFYLAEMCRVLGFSGKTALVDILKDWGITSEDFKEPKAP